MKARRLSVSLSQRLQEFERRFETLNREFQQFKQQLESEGAGSWQNLPVLLMV